MEKKGNVYGPIGVKPPEVHEAALDYRTGKKQGEYTLEDYYAIPEGKRMELIDGVLYDMTSAPSYIHQAIAAAVFRQLDAYIEQKGGSCMPFFAPCDVQLDCDNRTMVQPDKQTITVYDLEHDSFPVVYGFRDQIPVNIFDGDCLVDFAKILERIEFLYEREDY